MGFDSLLEIDYGGRTPGKNTKNVKMFFWKNNERNKKKIRQERHLLFIIYYFFDVFGYKESTRKTKKMIRK